MNFMPPFNLQKWIQENESLLRPPVNNKVIYLDSTFIIMIVGGPNHRADYHINQTDEFFYQIKGAMNLKIRNKEGVFEDILINEGEIFLLPGGVPHSPQRFENTIGLVIEKNRTPSDQDSFVWYCSSCSGVLNKYTLNLTNIEKQVKESIENHYANPNNYTCKKCGVIHAKN